LLDMLLHVRHTDACCHVPVDVAHVVAGLVLAHFRELHSLPAEDGVVFAAEQRRNESAGAQLDQPYLAQHITRDGLPCRRRGSLGGGRPAQERQRAHGASIVARMRSTMSPAVTSSAPASKLVMTRCRSTSEPMALTSSGRT